jgi:beta-glucosidase-like glycosyl hydrolase
MMREDGDVQRLWTVIGLVVSGAWIAAQSALPASLLPEVLDRAATRWVDDTFRRMTLDDKVGQLVFTAVNTTYLATDSDEFAAVAERIARLRLGGIHVFGGSEPVPGVLLNPAYGSVTLGQPLEAASLLNRLQAKATQPLLVTADFEAGVGFRIAGATTFPRAMAIAAGGGELAAFEAGRVTATEARALGVHLNFAPVADVNNNPRNPVINTRSFGEAPAAVGRLTAAAIRGLHAGGMLATLKHFPGHGDTDVDSHIGLPVITHPRDRLDAIELAPFRDGLAAGADAVMTGHIQVPSLDPAEFSPATLSQPIATGLLRRDLAFEGLIVTDSMGMSAITAKLPPGDAAVRAVLAGNDVVLHSPDDEAAVAGIKAAVERGEIAAAQIDASVRRILRAKARLGLHRTRTVPLDAVSDKVGGRTHAAFARDASAQSITLLRDDRNQVPLRMPREATVLYLSVLDYPSGWRIAAPGRTAIPELRKRWPALTAIELSDRTSPGELELVRASASRYDAIIASVYVRTASGSGRLDLSPALVRLLGDLAGITANTPKPFVTVFYGNPYAAMATPTLPAVLLTYDFYDLAEASLVRALSGEAPIGGRLPVALPGLFELGHGLSRQP